MAWEKAQFPTSLRDRIQEVFGWVDRRAGVGLYINQMDEWWFVHLNTGHGVCKMVGTLLQVLPLATELKEVTDWTFDGVTGWKNRDPDLPRKIGEIWARNPMRMPDDIPGEHLRDERHARAIMLAQMEADGEC